MGHGPPGKDAAGKQPNNPQKMSLAFNKLSRSCARFRARAVSSSVRNSSLYLPRATAHGLARDLRLSLFPNILRFAPSQSREAYSSRERKRRFSPPQPRPLRYSHEQLPRKRWLDSLPSDVIFYGIMVANGLVFGAWYVAKVNAVSRTFLLSHIFLQILVGTR